MGSSAAAGPVIEDHLPIPCRAMHSGPRKGENVMLLADLTRKLVPDSPVPLVRGIAEVAPQLVEMSLREQVFCP